MWASGAGGLYQISRVPKDIILHLFFLCLFLNTQCANTLDSLIRLQNTVIQLFLTASLLNLGLESLCFSLPFSVSLMSRVAVLSSVALFKPPQILLSAVKHKNKIRCRIPYTQSRELVTHILWHRWHLRNLEYIQCVIKNSVCCVCLSHSICGTDPQR